MTETEHKLEAPVSKLRLRDPQLYAVGGPREMAFREVAMQKARVARAQSVTAAQARSAWKPYGDCYLTLMDWSAKAMKEDKGTIYYLVFAVNDLGHKDDGKEFTMPYTVWAPDPSRADDQYSASDIKSFLIVAISDSAPDAEQRRANVTTAVDCEDYWGVELNDLVGYTHEEGGTPIVFKCNLESVPSTRINPKTNKPWPDRDRLRIFEEVAVPDAPGPVGPADDSDTTPKAGAAAEGFEVEPPAAKAVEPLPPVAAAEPTAPPKRRKR